MNPDVARYVPSLEALQAAACALEVQTWRHPFGIDLLRVEPTERRKLAAVVVTARLQRRSTTEIETEVPVTRAAQIPETLPERPDDWSDREVDVIAERLAARSGPCSFCPPTQRGFHLCGACGGLGSVTPDDSTVACVGCGGSGRVACANCDGSGVSVRVRLQTIRDVSCELRYAYVPALPFTIEERLCQLLQPTADPPECLRFDMAPRRAGSAYRDVLEVDPVFEGHEFGDALARARTAIQRLADGDPILRQDVRAYAWPLLLLRWQGLGLDRTVAIVIRPGDLAHLVVE